MWLATGVASLGAAASSALDEAALARLLRGVEEARAARRRPRAKPLRVREQSIIAALREPQRLIELNRPLPLANMVELVRMAWAEAAGAAAGAGAGAGTGAGAGLGGSAGLGAGVAGGSGNGAGGAGGGSGVAG